MGLKPDTPDWYVVSLLTHDAAAGSIKLNAERCYYLVAASDHERAYEKSAQLSRQLQHKNFTGVEDLWLVHEPLADGAELLWSQLELTGQELDKITLQSKEESRAFREASLRKSSWYVGKVVLCEVHDEGSHGNQLLVWINSYLIKASNAEIAFRTSLRIGRKQQDEPGSHRCDGEKAHWVFKGIEDVIPIHDSLHDGARLWCDQLEVTAAELRSMVPDRSGLSVFKWAAEQAREE